MRISKIGMMAVILAVVMTLPVIIPSSQTDAASGIEVLLDEGNGHVEWITADGDDVDDVLSDALSALGRTYQSSGGDIVVDGLSERTVGGTSTGGSPTEVGTTGVVVTSSWHAYGWDGDSWVDIADITVANTYPALAVGFYPDGVAPVADPDCRYPMVMSRADASNTASQTAQLGDSTGYENAWYMKGAALSSPLYADGKLFYKFGHFNTYTPSLKCIDVATGQVVWEYGFSSGANYESSSPLIVGDRIYMATMTNEIHAFELTQTPNTPVVPVASFKASDYPGFEDYSGLEGTNYLSGFTSLVYDSGAIYVANSNGMLYCFDMDLNLVWSYRMGGAAYLIAPTVHDGMVFMGALNGHLYMLDSANGSLIEDENVYQKDYGGKIYGNVGQVAVREDASGDLMLYFTVSDGLGMSQMNSGIAVYKYTSAGGLSKVKLVDDSTTIYGRHVLPVTTEDFSGAYYFCSDGKDTMLKRISKDGTIEVMTSGLGEIHASPVIVNNQLIYGVGHAASDPIYVIDVEGDVKGTFMCAPEVRQFNMMPVIVIDGYIIAGTDAGLYAHEGGYVPVTSSDGGSDLPLSYLALVVLLIAAIMLFLYWKVMRSKGVQNPFGCLGSRISGKEMSNYKRRKHRFKLIIGIGVVLVFVAFTLCLCIGATSVLNPIDAYGALFSAISKGGNGLDLVETSVYTSRLPRTVAALAIGIGLSVAGCVYQAIIRNPMVDPYIMGVSSGAGIAAVAVIAFDFTLFGLFSSHSVYLTAIVAMIGGLAAFFCTMLLAEKSGGASINYVLAGIVVGLAAGALQSLMLTMSGGKLNSAIAWLYGSLAEVTLEQVGIIVFLSIFLSLVPLLWAKELNLVLLGEDQAQQMGLNVRKFNRTMLILASVLTSVCVAFVGIIGFVGLVVPHLCRMLFGSDHRMVLPASIFFGAVMLMLADLLARTGYHGMELPVGAITTIIGIPVFAYLLIKRGRMYDG